MIPNWKKPRAAAAANNTSLNKIVQKTLKEALGIANSPTKKSDFSDLAGSWTKDEAREFEEATADYSLIDKEM